MAETMQSRANGDAKRDLGRMASGASAYIDQLFLREFDACFREMERTVREGKVTSEWALSIVARLHAVRQLQATCRADQKAAQAAREDKHGTALTD